MTKKGWLVVGIAAIAWYLFIRPKSAAAAATSVPMQPDAPTGGQTSAYSGGVDIQFGGVKITRDTDEGREVETYPYAF